MNNKDLYKEVFSQVHTSVQINLEDYQNMKKQRIPARAFAALVAVAALLAAMTATTLAFNLFGLRDLAFPDRTTLHVPHVDGSTGSVSYEDRVVDMISLQGYADTPESRACMEWEDFYAAYTADRKFDNSIYPTDEAHSLYSVYDEVMEAKLDEIAAKYGLKLHQTLADVPGQEAWLETLGDTFLNSGNIGYFGYRYGDGTCAFDGTVDLGRDYGAIDYQFRYARKGYLDTVTLNVGNLDDYEDWDYRTRWGVDVKLALGPNRCYIWADLEEGFVFVNVLTGTGGSDLFSDVAIDQTGLEAVADSFDFSVLS